MSKQSYDEKFKSFIKMCAQATNADGVDANMIHHSEVFGDSYTEVIESQIDSLRQNCSWRLLHFQSAANWTHQSVKD